MQDESPDANVAPLPSNGEKPLPKLKPPRGVLAEVNRWVPRLTLILSFVAVAACAGMWLMVAGLARDVPGDEFGGLARGIFAIALLCLILIGSSVGCVLALIGLVHVAFARRRFGKLLALSLGLNAAAGPLPYLGNYIRVYYERNPPLVRAVNSGSIQRLQSLLSAREIPSQPGREGYLALNAAVAAGRMDMINAIVRVYGKSGRNSPFAVTYEQALVTASYGNNPELVRQLLQAGANSNLPPPGGSYSAILIAARKGNRGVFQALVDGGAIVSADALEDVVLQGNVDAVKLLVAHYPDRRFKRNPAFGAELLSIAASRAPVEMTKTLLDAGADPTIKPLGQLTPMPLQAAVGRGDLEIIRLLLEDGADPNDPRSCFHNGPNPGNLLKRAEEGAKITNDRRVVKLLQSHGAK